jgi:hypothetical protein
MITEGIYYSASIPNVLSVEGVTRTVTTVNTPTDIRITFTLKNFVPSDGVIDIILPITS